MTAPIESATSTNAPQNADTATADAAATTAAATDAATGSANDSDKTDYKAEAEKYRALSRKHEERAKANAKAAEELKKLQDADLSETQRLQRQLEETGKAATAAELRAVRAELAVEFELPAKWAARIHGDTPEDCKREAQALKADLDELRGAQTTAGQPGLANLRQGARQTARTPESPDQALRRMAGYG